MPTFTGQRRLNSEIRSLIMRAVYEALSDPDLGLELSAKALARLRKAKLSKSKGIPSSAIKRKYL